LLLIGGIPLAILSFFGVRKLTNLAAVLKLAQKQLDEARDQVAATRAQAEALVTQQQSIQQTAGDLELQYQKIRTDAQKVVHEISTVQLQVTEEGEKASLAIRTATAEALKALPQGGAEIALAPTAKNGWPDDGSLLTIPIVVHVVYSSAKQNISDEQIQSQIQVLNLDYSAQNEDISNVPEPFKPFIGDARIQFALATKDPAGNATTGITRTHTSRMEFAVQAKVTSPAQGGAAAWDPARYLNIWVCRLGSGLLSASQTPGSTDDWDGVIVDYSAFGTIGTATVPFNKGRTATSAIAKYLNLIHIWSDDCQDRDLVPDTPPQHGPNFGKPTFPHISCNNAPHGDMFMNFMDYVDDDVMCMFTKGQVQRMHETLLGPRRQLGRS
jgi:uncharacterized protein YoxC